MPASPRMVPARAVISSNTSHHTGGTLLSQSPRERVNDTPNPPALSTEGSRGGSLPCLLGSKLCTRIDPRSHESPGTLSTSQDTPLLRTRTKVGGRCEPKSEGDVCTPLIAKSQLHETATMHHATSAPRDECTLCLTLMYHLRSASGSRRVTRLGGMVDLEAWPLHPQQAQHRVSQPDSAPRKERTSITFAPTGPTLHRRKTHHHTFFYCCVCSASACSVRYVTSVDCRRFATALLAVDALRLAPEARHAPYAPTSLKRPTAHGAHHNLPPNPGCFRTTCRQTALHLLFRECSGAMILLLNAARKSHWADRLPGLTFPAFPCWAGGHRHHGFARAQRDPDRVD